MRIGLKLAEHLRTLCESVGHNLMKKSSVSSTRGETLNARIARWWSTHSVAAPSTVMKQGALAAVCFVVLAAGMPLLFSASMERQDAAEFRERNIRLAESQDAGEVLRADAKASELLKHDWLRSVEYSLERDPSSALSRYAAIERDRAALAGLQTFQAVHMDRAEDMAAQAKCLAQAVYYEARSESTSGQLAVAEVIMNRVLDHRYPNTVCDVVFQGATRTTGCQFTFTCDGAMNKTPRGKRWDKATQVASHVLMGLNEKKTSGATHYHATYVDPVWNSGLVRTRRIGTHIFYRFPRGAEWTRAKAAMDLRLQQRRAGISTLTPASAAAPKTSSVIKTAPEGALPEASIESETPVETSAPATTASVVSDEISVAEARPADSEALSLIDIPATGG